jgi:hypothetical protein
MEGGIRHGAETVLRQRSVAMSAFDPSAYPPSIAALLRQRPLAPLGPGRPIQAVKEKLLALDDAAFSGPIRDRGMAVACRAGLWLAFDFLDESHEISQGLHTVEGSFWHGILHRREPDASNAAYWFRRVDSHAVFPQLAAEARALGLPQPDGAWDPFAFIDACERHRSDGTDAEMLLRKVQMREWELLFDWCFSRAAAGR